MSGTDDASRERMPGDAEAAGVVQEILEQRVGWSAGDRLTFVRHDLGITQPAAARVVLVMQDGRLLVETQAPCSDGGAWMCVVGVSQIVERLA